LRRAFRIIQRVVVADPVALIVQNGGKLIRYCMSRFRSDLLMLAWVLEAAKAWKVRLWAILLSLLPNNWCRTVTLCVVSY
jgi:hypothetical protein